MALYGSSIPLDSGETVVTVICPNAYSHSRLMQALNNIVPEAGTPVPNTGNAEVIPPQPEQLYNRDPEQEDDTGEAFSV